MLRIAVVTGSTRPGRNNEAVAKWVYEIALKRSDAEVELVDIHDFKLPLLDDWNRERAEAAAFYDDALAGVGDLRLPPRAAGSTPVWHLYVIRSGRRDALMAHLADEGIATSRHYPEPPHLSDAFSHLADGMGSFPVTERIAAELLSLPLFPGIEPEQLEAVVDAIRAFFGDG